MGFLDQYTPIFKDKIFVMFGVHVAMGTIVMQPLESLTVITKTLLLYMCKNWHHYWLVSCLIFLDYQLRTINILISYDYINNFNC